VNRPQQREGRLHSQDYTHFRCQQDVVRREVKMPDQNKVGFQVVGESKFKLLYNSAMLSDHVLDYAAAKAKDRSGQMRRLLAAAACGCFSGYFYTKLKKRRVEVNSLQSTATATTGRDPENGCIRVTDVQIRVEIDVPDSDVDAVEAAERELEEEGCIILNSLAPGISVKTQIVRLSKA
jgi:uncharacterized OsmC-like protein